MTNVPNPVEDCENMKNQQVAADNEAEPSPNRNPRVDLPCTNSVPGISTGLRGDLPHTDSVPTTHRVPGSTSSLVPVSAIDAWLVPTAPMQVPASSPDLESGASTWAPVAGPDAPCESVAPHGPASTSTPGIVPGSSAAQGSGDIAVPDQVST
jgi:hypothetical protein